MPQLLVKIRTCLVLNAFGDDISFQTKQDFITYPPPPPPVMTKTNLVIGIKSLSMCAQNFK